LIERCAGTVVIALERTYFKEGIEKRGAGKNKDSVENLA
jgi:hypothetical protein